LNLVISPLAARGTVVISSPCWPTMRRAVSPSSMVTVFPAWLKPTWLSADPARAEAIRASGAPVLADRHRNCPRAGVR
jgi:hypothetical protein